MFFLSTFLFGVLFGGLFIKIINQESVNFVARRGLETDSASESVFLLILLLSVGCWKLVIVVLCDYVHV